MNTTKTVILLSCAASICFAVSVSDQLTSSGFTRMSSALNDSGLNETVKGTGPYTIFVPSNQAFENTTLPSDKQELSNLIKNYVVEGNLTTSNLTGEWTTLGGSKLNITKLANGTFVINNQTRISKPDIMTDNGVIEVIDSMIQNATTAIGNKTSGQPSNASSSGNSAH